jgi:hypothetical protein
MCLGVREAISSLGLRVEGLGAGDGIIQLRMDNE